MNISVSSKQLVGFGAVVAGVVIGYGYATTAKDVSQIPTMLLIIMGVAGAVAVVLSASGAEGGEDVGTVAEAIRRARNGERPSPPIGASLALARIFDELGRFGDEDQKRVREGKEMIAEIENHVRKLGEGIQTQVIAAEDTSRLAKEIATSMRQFSSSVDSLTHNAEESSSSILEMTATSTEVANNLGDLAQNVRESVSSIEEMVVSIKEVAKNVDALSETAEETSSSMNEMDVSIDQVKSNANETERLSEDVTNDAEEGGRAILKTISEIFRIKESSQEAVSVISTLGSRIDAIGQIVNVIDDVAEQTNLLALNAAIIAAQAGEQGKGFAVVADEIKDLAERAGASTREITDLIKTVQGESKNAIAAVERGALNVDRGVEVSNEAERALKKILDSTRKSTDMVRAIARATVEQAKGSRQVTDAISRIAMTSVQIAAATNQQVKGSDLIIKSADKMRMITQQVERSANEQAKGSRQITTAIENISGMVTDLNSGNKLHGDTAKQLTTMVQRVEESARAQEAALRQLTNAIAAVRIR